MQVGSFVDVLRSNELMVVREVLWAPLATLANGFRQHERQGIGYDDLSASQGAGSRAFLVSSGLEIC